MEIDISFNSTTILIADDDHEDRMLIKEAFEENQFSIDLRFVENGEELIDYLRRRGVYANSKDSPRPQLILLDLNMPRIGGREALQELKTDPDLRAIPVVVLTTSTAGEDIMGTYDLGANSFLTKPVSYEGLCTLVENFRKYWFELVKLPNFNGNIAHEINYNKNPVDRG